MCFLNESFSLLLSFREKRLDQERDLLVRQQQFLQDELDKRTRELLDARREKTNRLLELQVDLSEKIEEVGIFSLHLRVLNSVLKRPLKCGRSVHQLILSKTCKVHNKKIVFLSFKRRYRCKLVFFPFNKN